MDQCAFNALHVDTRGRRLYYIRAKGERSLALLATRQACKPQRLSLIGYAPNWISYVPPSWSTWRVQKHKRGGFMLLIYDYEKQHFAPWLLNSRFEGPEHREKRRKNLAAHPRRNAGREMWRGRCYANNARLPIFGLLMAVIGDTRWRYFAVCCDRQYINAF